MATLIPILGMCYAIRITLAYEDLSGIMGTIMAVSEGAVVVQHEEEGKRTHQHMAVYNCTISHDRLRKNLVASLNEALPDLSGEVGGNAYLSVKKWDGKEKYLNYMFKGKNLPTYNYNKLLALKRDDQVLPDEEVERIMKLWVSTCSEENEYSAWKASEYFPKLAIKKMDPKDQGSTDTVTYWNFDDVVDAARKFAVRETGFMSNKTRFVANNLISNFCMFKKIKISSYRI